MKSAKTYISTFFPVMICKFVSTKCIGYIHLYHNNFRLIINIKFFHMFILQNNIIIVIAISS